VPQRSRGFLITLNSRCSGSFHPRPALAGQARDQEKWMPVFRPIARQAWDFDHVIRSDRYDLT